MSSKLYRNILPFTAAKDSRPILKGICYDSDGSLVATNSHIAIQVKGVHSFKETMVIDPRSLEQIEGAYPNINRLIPTEGDWRLHLLLSEMKQLYDMVKTFRKEHVTITLDQSRLELSINELTFELFTKDKLRNEESITFTLSVQYLMNGLKVFIDEGLDIDWLINHPLRPSLMSAAHINVLITPIRTS